MKTNNVICNKSIELGAEIVRLHLFLTKEKREFVLSKQILRSGTSVGANVTEGVVAPSKKEFCYRISIAYKEARETEYWLMLLCMTGYLTEEKAAPIKAKCDEVNRILYAILRTASNPPAK